MKPLFLLLSFLPVWVPVVAQTLGASESGGSQVRIITTDARRQPVFGATVYLRLSTDSTKILNAITDTAGIAVLNLRPDALYDLRITAVGMKPLVQGIRPTKAQPLFRFTLDVDTQTLAAVTVTGRKPLMRQEDDITIVDPEPIANSSTNAYELLTKTPGLFLDQEGHVYLSSSTPATIYINGREQRMGAEDVATLLRSPRRLDRYGPSQPAGAI